MAKFNLTIADAEDGGVSLESSIVEGDLDGEPTPSMIVMAFIGAHAGDICVESVRWAKQIMADTRKSEINEAIDAATVIAPQKSIVLPS